MASPSTGPPSSSSADVHPFTSFRFEVNIDVHRVSTVVHGVFSNDVHGVLNNVCAALFSDVDGLELSIEPKTIREGGRNTGPVHMAGGVSYGQLSLKRGMTANFDLWKWFEAVAAPGGGNLRGNANITMLAGNGSQQAVFALTGCLPIKLKAPALNAKDGLIAIEEMSIAYESLIMSTAKSNMPGQ